MSVVLSFPIEAVKELVSTAKAARDHRSSPRSPKIIFGKGEGIFLKYDTAMVYALGYGPKQKTACQKAIPEDDFSVSVAIADFDNLFARKPQLITIEIAQKAIRISWK